jgi:hypothetical protein
VSVPEKDRRQSEIVADSSWREPGGAGPEGGGE